jgi:hypothetical protein
VKGNESIIQSSESACREQRRKLFTMHSVPNGIKSAMERHFFFAETAKTLSSPTFHVFRLDSVMLTCAMCSSRGSMRWSKWLLQQDSTTRRLEPAQGV